MDESHKLKLAEARAKAREARKNAVEAEEVTEPEKYGGAEANEIDSLRAELAALKNKHREKAAHEHETISGRERINDPGQVNGAQADIQESLRELIREQLEATFPERTAVRTTSRKSVRPGAVVAHDRDGNPIYRKRDALADPFAIPEDLQDPAWDRAWIRVSTYGQEDTSNQIARFENGWRFINADRPGFEARFMPPGYKGHIFKDGLALVERPMVLSEEARREENQIVKAQSRAQRQQFGMALPEGFSSQTEAARANTFARSGQREAVPETLKPNLRAALDID